jgi:hypothetical protein
MSAKFFLSRAKFAIKIEPKILPNLNFSQNFIKILPKFPHFQIIRAEEMKSFSAAQRLLRAKFGPQFAQRCSKLYLSDYKLYISN